MVGRATPLCWSLWHLKRLARCLMIGYIPSATPFTTSIYSVKKTSSVCPHHPGPLALPIAPSTGDSCMPSVIRHHSCTLGFAAIRAISSSNALPTYLKLANNVGRGLRLRKIESGGVSHARLVHVYEPIQSLMLESLICSKTSGHTLAWHSL
jgi:hypothetical protein